ncbi:helix-hairpin-helix domain-containing protein [Bacillus sp. NPDC094106]|uniref:SF1B family DNA helicase RecD2 n=1 Tax=Bacillus sp. NPDC094106 TaxID=3363949 RepID=UPI0038268B42
MKHLSVFNLENYLSEPKSALEDFEIDDEITIVTLPLEEIYGDSESGYRVYSCQSEEGLYFKMNGNFIMPLNPNIHYQVNGNIIFYKGEKQVKMKRVSPIKPIGKRGIIRYLRTLKGLKNRAEEIYTVFGDKSIDVLMETPEEVVSRIKGIGKKSVEAWKKQLESLTNSQYTLSYLLDIGLSFEQSKTLYSQYNDDIIRLISENPYLLAKEIPGYGFKKCDKIAKEIHFDMLSDERVQEGIIHGLDEATKDGHCFLHKEDLIEKTREVLKVTLPIKESERLLNETSDETISYYFGTIHVLIPRNELRVCYERWKSARYKNEKDKFLYPLFEISSDRIVEEINSLLSLERIIIEQERVYLDYIHRAEVRVAEEIYRLSDSQEWKKQIDIKAELDKYLYTEGIELEDKQEEAILSFTARRGGFYILDGSAGCGKTFVLKIMLKILNIVCKANGIVPYLQLLAPTGKAAKVAKKSTNEKCLTVHRGLEFCSGNGFYYNASNPLPGNIIVLDESSFLDVILSKDLLQAIKRGATIIWMGDIKQLPSIGPGSVLKDLIESGVVPVVTLDVVKRQGKQSGIAKNAKKIIDGEMIETCEDTKDSYVVFRDSPKVILKNILESVKRILTFPDYTLDDIQILSPQKSGVLGTYMINLLMQQAFNQSASPITSLNKEFSIDKERYSLYFKEGDKVINLKNNDLKIWYKKGYITTEDNEILTKYEPNKDAVGGITNGETGVIEAIRKVKVKIGDTEKTKEIIRIIVKYDDGYIFYDDKEKEELDHAYAFSIHKAQGSQWKACIMPISMLHYRMLDNSLFYTGYTRAQEFNVVIGEERAIKHAIKTYKSRERNTTLKERLESLYLI